MSYATPGDVAVRLGRELSEEEEAQVQVLLDDVELIIKLRVPDLDEKITDGTIQEAVVVMIEANSVARVLRNPEGYLSETDGNYSYQINTSVASGLLDILGVEWGWLGVSRGIYTIAPYVNVPYPARYCDPNIWEVQ